MAVIVSDFAACSFAGWIGPDKRYSGDAHNSNTGQEIGERYKSCRSDNKSI